MGIGFRGLGRFGSRVYGFRGGLRIRGSLHVHCPVRVC